jgi:hypothetical protein
MRVCCEKREHAMSEEFPTPFIGTKEQIRMVTSWKNGV